LGVRSIGLEEIGAVPRAGPGIASARDHALIGVSPSEKRSAGFERRVP
jgi:hypothetical protein